MTRRLLISFALIASLVCPQEAVIRRKPPAAGGSFGTSFVTGQTLGSLANNFTGYIGFKMTMGGSGVTMDGICRWVVSGNSQSHTLYVVNAVGDTILGSATVNTSGATAGQFLCASISVALSASTVYYVLSQETNGGDQWYDDTTTVTTTAIATVNDGRYATSVPSVPNLNTSGSKSYGPVSFTYH